MVVKTSPELSLKEQVHALKEELNAVIVAHNYQRPEIQDVADFVGDSLELAVKASQVSGIDYIFFCGVHFMAETAAILSPEATVVLPDSTAGCPLADMITPEDVIELKKQYPDAPAVAYVNTSAAVKAAVDICCTSSNAVKVVNSLGAEQVIFVPDRNLAHYVSRGTSAKIVPWTGFCPTHQLFSVQDVERARADHPDAAVVVHPECRPEVQEAADFILSTGGMMRLPGGSNHSAYIIGTETGIIYRLKKTYPEKEFFPLNERAICPNMKKITLEKLVNSMKTLQPVIEVDRATALKASLAIKRMVALA